MKTKKMFLFLTASSLLLTGCGNSKVTKNKVYWRVKMSVSELDKSRGYMFDNKIMYSVSVKDGKEEKTRYATSWGWWKTPFKKNVVFEERE